MDEHLFRGGLLMSVARTQSNHKPHNHSGQTFYVPSFFFHTLKTLELVNPEYRGLLAHLLPGGIT